MDIKKLYKEIQQKYGLTDGVQELFLCEAYLKVCKEYFAKDKYKKAAIYGAGRNTKEIMNSMIWKEIKGYIKVIIDNHSQMKEIQGIPIISEQELAQYDIETVLVSSWEYHEEMILSITMNFPKMEIFDPYKYVLEEFTQIKEAFFIYKGHEKYQWFAKRRKELEDTNDGMRRRELLKELIHGYYAIYDWVNLKDTLLLYRSEEYEDKEKYQCLERDIDIFLGDIQKEIENRRQGDCLVFLVDALSKYVVDEMPYLSDWKKRGISFENYINEYPSTREVLTAMLTGWHCFADKTYLAKKIKYGDSDLLQAVERNDMEIKLISATHSAENYSEINCYMQGVNEDLLLTEILFRGMEELLKSEKRQIVIMHSFDTVHPYHYNPISTELNWISTWETHKKRFEQSVLFTDHVLDFYLKLLDENKELTKIVMGDHGINLETEYAYGVAHVPIHGNIGLWDMETMSPALMIWKKDLSPKVVNKLVSTTSFHKILNAAIQNVDIESVLENKKFLELEFVPGYDKYWLQDYVAGSHSYYLGIGMKGILSSHFLFASFEDGTERLFEIHGKDLVECNDKMGAFTDEIGEKNYIACKFPNDLLKNDFFELHNKYYNAEFKNKCENRGGICCIIRNIDLEITERCSLKCRDCFNCMQYYKKPEDIPLDNIKRSLDNLTEYADSITEVRILGGEPFMNKKLKEIVVYVCEKENVGRVIIYTNATILPTKEELKVFQHEKVSFYITDYGIEKRQKLKEFEDLLTEYEVPYQVHKLEYWYKPGDISDNHKTKEELESIYKFCWGRDCITLLEGKLFQCEFAANANRLRAIPDFKEDYVDLFDTENLRNKLIEFLYKKTSMESCRWCNLTTKKVKPGVQTVKSLEYKEYDGTE